ncbi:UBC-like protein [Metschnikowia bicuspidata var. bicuspidata NRRL YB-4993]|uniref:Ubiquitin-conjugating enzyme E2 6 n=1 Tax=Metschnikowia bicuspidata var. bicuspidata NRRL YB-4993 TaxID=869754 RepID=A0A1A0HE14_9ASCO|nr:UBC-like protein [Metschnikowia bicuspidata var. bicuspidata NRRL YB-4993]OBA22143.1 UBC-like protein [Metschnikowia bicuspidata var. bicuspidata NRRL YB-4993]
MVSRQAQKRLNKEYKTIQANATPFVTAKPTDENILEWHYVISGPPGTPYENGQYHGLLRFPPDYPFKPPSISMVTPNGRFACNTRLCLSMSDYHPDTWNPAWSVLTILTGLLSFMTGDEHTTGSIATSDAVKRKLAGDSHRWNSAENTRFAAVFADLHAANQAHIAARDEEAARQAAAAERARGVGPDAAAAAMDPEDRARLQAGREGARPAGPATLLKMAGFALAAVLAVYVALVGA